MPELKRIKEEVRPYYDSEIPAAMKRIVTSPLLGDMVGYAMPEKTLDEVKQLIASFKTASEFQKGFVVKVVENIMRTTSASITFGGSEYIDNNGHLYISNHRDIILDSSLFQIALLNAGLPTTEISFGSNLVSPGFIEDFGRSNKMYKILRSKNTRDLIRNSKILSEHIHEVVANNKSIWISQRDGRTKNGCDRTDQGLVKMLTMNGDKDIRQSLKEINIQPFAISYEYESCDALKTRELYLSRRGPYTKAPGEDFKSIITGVKQNKGNIHIEICEPISNKEIDSVSGDNNNEVLRNIANIIDTRIISAYRLFNTNYIAYDIRRGLSQFAERYTDQERDSFQKYINSHVDSLDGDRDELLEIFLDIYANPVQSKLDFGVEI